MVAPGARAVTADELAAVGRAFRAWAWGMAARYWDARYRFCGMRRLWDYARWYEAGRVYATNDPDVSAVELISVPVPLPDAGRGRRGRLDSVKIWRVW